MNRYELFCMIFMALDADWDESQNEELGQFLSEANPFLFCEETSADPAVYANFCKIIGERKINIENSFEIAKEYVNQLNIPVISESFASLKKKQWDSALMEYLSRENKGDEC